MRKSVFIVLLSALLLTNPDLAPAAEAETHCLGASSLIQRPVNAPLFREAAEQV
jgi:hypothetical protein